MELNSRKVTIFASLLLSVIFLTQGWSAEITDAENLSRLTVYIDHTPIYVDGNSALQTMASSESWPGSGSEIDPYIISSYRINGSGYEYGIEVRNIDLHLHIRGNLIQRTDQGPGLTVSNCRNIVIQGNMIRDTETHPNLFVYDSTDILVIGNRLEANLTQYNVRFSSSNGIVFDSNEVFWSSGGATLIFTVQDIRITDNLFSGVGYTAISISSCDLVLIQGNVVRDCGGFAITSSPSDTHLTVYDNMMYGCGVSFSSLRTATIADNNTIDDVPVRFYSEEDLTGIPIPHDTSQFLLYNVTGFLLEGMEYYMGYELISALNSDNLTIQDCTIDGGSRQFYTQNCIDVTFRNARFLNFTNTVVNSFHGSGYIFENNSIQGEGGVMSLGQGSGLKVTGNELIVGKQGIMLNQMKDVEIDNNRFLKGEVNATGITMNFPQKFNLTRNDFIDYTGTGINIMSGNTGSVNNNQISGIGVKSGMFISYPNSMKVHDNIITGFEYGIDMVHTAVETDVIHNRIEDNTESGIRVQNSHGIEIQDNLIFNNTGYGIEFFYSGYCLTANNTFINNHGSDDTYSTLTIQARDDGDGNFWNDTSGGNYWRDLDSEDGDGDGILDDPYLIFGTTTYDKKPLAEPSYEYLSEPEDFSITTMMDSILLEWSPPEIDIDGSMTGYVLRRTGGSGPELEIDLLGSSLSYHDGDVEDGTTYSYSLAGINRYGEGSRTSVLEGTPDSTAPYVSFTSPLNGTITTENDIDLAWVTSDNVGVVLTELRMNEGHWFDVGMNTSHKASNLTEGLNHFYLRSFDALGNNGTDQISIIIDMTDPEIEILAPENGTITSQGTMVVDWGGADLITNIGRYRIRVDDGNWLDVGNSSRWNITLENDGIHIVNVMAEDLAGNTAVDSIEVILDTTSPDVFFTFPVEGYNTTERTLKVSWAAYDLLSAIGSFYISLDNGVEVALSALVKEYTFASLDIGVHTVYLTAFDAAGNPSSIQVSFNILDPNIEPTETVIRGLVTDEDGEPLHNVKVISENGEETRTDSNGYFALEVERGSVILTFKKKGYKDQDELVEADPFPVNDSLMIQLEKVKEEPGFFSSFLERTFCQVCCVAAVVIPLLLFVLGLIRRSRTKKRKRMKKEKKMLEE